MLFDISWINYLTWIIIGVLIPFVPIIGTILLASPIKSHFSLDYKYAVIVTLFGSFTGGIGYKIITGNILTDLDTSALFFAFIIAVVFLFNATVASLTSETEKKK